MLLKTRPTPKISGHASPVLSETGKAIKKQAWHSVSIIRGRNACAAVVQANGQKWLSAQAPQLPIKAATPSNVSAATGIMPTDARPIAGKLTAWFPGRLSMANGARVKLTGAKRKSLSRAKLGHEYVGSRWLSCNCHETANHAVAAFLCQ